MPPAEVVQEVMVEILLIVVEIELTNVVTPESAEKSVVVYEMPDKTKAKFIIANTSRVAEGQ